MHLRMASPPTSSHLDQGFFAEAPPESGVQGCSRLAAAEVRASPAGTLPAEQNCHSGGCPTMATSSPLSTIALTGPHQEASQKKMKSWSGSFLRQLHKGRSKGGESPPLEIPLSRLPSGEPASTRKGWSGSFSGRLQRTGLTPSMTRDSKVGNSAEESVHGCEAFSKDRRRSWSARFEGSDTTLASAVSVSSFRLSEIHQASSPLSSSRSTEGTSAAATPRTPFSSESSPPSADSCCSSPSFSNSNQHGFAFADSLTSPMTSDGTDDISNLLHTLLASRGVPQERRAEGYVIDPEEVEMGDVIAVGASGEVSKAVYRGKTVTVKILKGSFSKQVSKALLTELRREVGTLIACSECPQLLKFHGLFVDSEARVGVVTEYLPGGTLFKFLRRRRGAELPMSQILRIARDIAQGMSSLHQEGVIHRDLKSENVLLDAEGRAVVCDFAMARLKGDRGDMTNEVGTYRWMAPEAFGTTNWPVTHRADVYSFGVILWELVTLSVPFEGMNNMQAAMAVGMKGHRPSIPPHCLPQLRRLIERCWASNPNHRPDFADILEALKGMPLV